MPKFAQLFDLKEYEKNDTTIRDNKIYMEFCKIVSCQGPNGETRLTR